MQIQLINVAQKLPAWVDQACNDYLKRLPREVSLQLVTIPLPARKSQQSPARQQQRESELILPKLTAGSLNIALDERGQATVDVRVSTGKPGYRWPRWVVRRLSQGLSAQGLPGQNDDASCPRQSSAGGAVIPRLDDSARPPLSSPIGDPGQLSGYHASMIYLASRSPRRTELLHQIGVEFLLHDIDIDESRLSAESATDYVCRMATTKAGIAREQIAHEKISTQQESCVVLAADTIIALDDDIIGKPADRDQCRCILERLSARQHLVLTAVALATVEDTALRLTRNRVSFKSLSAQEIKSYCATEEPMDKAGAYAIQGKAALFIDHLEGSYSAVMGLPLFETAELLRNADIELF